MADSNSMKYLIKATIKADGTIQRKDVVGAIFGQTEGLLGDELNLRVLQRSGRLGHVDVSLESNKGKVSGEISIPSSMDNVETAIIGSALETIDRIGPCRAIIRVSELLDVRASKRSAVVDRAKDLLVALMSSSTQMSRSVIEEVRSVLTVDEAKTWNGMTAGPNIQSSDALIIVEGRNDVINLLKGGIKNAVAVEGAGVKDELVELANSKSKVTVFVDGDRGGELVLRELHGALKVDDVAIAPTGQEVEHLQMKTITKCLSQKEAVEKVLSRFDSKSGGKGKRRAKKEAKKESKGIPIPDEMENLGVHYAALSSRSAVLVGADDSVSEPIGASKLSDACNESENIIAIVYKGVINNRIIDIASENNVATVVGSKIGSGVEKSETVEAYVVGE